MSLTKVSSDIIQKENEIQNSINQLIDENKNLIFNAGAGAGKTYALIESLKHIINIHGKKLKTHNQNVMCITYTNVAMNELKNRLKNTELIKVSTIHERLWNIIKDHQPQLIPIHVDNIKSTINSLENDIFINENNSKYAFFRSLNATQQQEFIALINIESVIELFNRVYNKDSSEFKKDFEPLNIDKTLLKNVSNFKSLVTKIHKKTKLEKCLISISNNEQKYQTIRYNSKFNSGVLHKMLISHDTLLKYSLKMLENDLLKRIIIHQYPYILIDEYQDTNGDVIKIMALLSNYALDNNCKLFVGYFGDTAQSIYDDGVGDKIYDAIGDIPRVDKPYNRRSAKEIINVINKIRNDDLKQESIYEDSTGGSVEFYNGQEENIDTFIDYYKNKWDIDKNNKLHCLVLTNKLVAKYNKFSALYDVISQTAHYERYYMTISTELLSNELTKLGEIPLLLYRVVDLKLKLENNNTIISEIIPSTIYKDLTFQDANKIINELCQICKNDNLKEFLGALFNKCNEENNILKEIIEYYITFQGFNFTFEGFTSNLLGKLFQNEPENKNAIKFIESLFNINFLEYKNWYNFINESTENEIIYHTYHGTKGEEYDNVIVIMENDFGKDKGKFSNFFLKYRKELEIDEKEKIKFNNTRNLLYVACSRAIKNLRLLYLATHFQFRFS